MRTYLRQIIPTVAVCTRMGTLSTIHAEPDEPRPFLETVTGHLSMQLLVYSNSQKMSIRTHQLAEYGAN